MIHLASLDTNTEKQGIDSAQTDQEKIEALKTLTGISNFTELTDLLTRLGPLQKAQASREDYEKLSSEVTKVGGVDAAKKVLADHAAVLGGQGSKSCLPNRARVATLHVYRDRIELGSYDPKEFPNLLAKLSLSKEMVERLSLEEFSKVFGEVKTLFPDCKFNVDLVEHSFDTRPRDVIRPIFWPSSYKKAPGLQ